jgi:thiol-disulfide isomerase/thioredoxin
MIPRRAAVLVALAWVHGCGPPAPERQAYHAMVVTADGYEIPFFLEIPSNCHLERAVITNGAERVAVPCQRLGKQVSVDFPVYGTRLFAEIDQAGHLAGEWSHARRTIDEDRLRFAARPIDRIDPTSRFPAPEAAATPPASTRVAAGTWRVEFDSHGPGKIVIATAGDGVAHGTAEIPSEYGDLRFLAGTARGQSFSISTFDGASAYLIRGHIGADGRMHGELISGSGAPDPFVADQSEDFDVVDPLQRVRVTSTEKRLDLAPLRASRYTDKAIIVELFGTWCSNCNDLAPLLAELHREHGAEGLEVLSLAYEISEDEKYTRERVAAYKERHGVSWEVLIPTGTPGELLSAGPAKLTPIGGVPVTIFFNRNRTIRAVYTGFWGPATGPSHQKAIDTFRQLTRDIVASPSSSR